MNAPFHGILARDTHLGGSARRWVMGLLAIGALAGVAVYWATRGEPAETVLPEVSQEALVPTDNGLYLEGSDEPFNGFMVTHYPDGVLRSRSQVVDGRLHGVSEGWYPEGQIETREVFVQGVSHGVRTRWHPNGQRSVRADISHGKLHGLFQRWHENGQLAQVIPMFDGAPHGVSEAFFPSGALQARVEMKNGQPISRQFWDEGKAPVN